MKRWLIALPVLFPAAALAHPGDHTGFDWAGLVAHVFESDHILFAVLAGLIGVLAYRAGRKAEAKAVLARTAARPKPEQEQRHDPR